ncbi:MAG: 4'-phosphopantetheinyl transferase family protein, partial [Actinomycetota bacterium]
SRGVLRCVLARYLAIEPQAVRMRSAAHGKPFLACGPRQLALRFNLSHSGGVALVAVARGREVGIDIESLGRVLDYERIITRFLSPDEQRMLAALPPTLRRQAFFTCWVRKEAYAKARGLGLSLPFEQFSVSVNPREPAALLSVERRLGDPSRWTLNDIPIGDRYVAAVAVEGAVEGAGCVFRRFTWPSAPQETF